MRIVITKRPDVLYGEVFRAEVFCEGADQIYAVLETPTLGECLNNVKYDAEECLREEAA